MSLEPRQVSDTPEALVTLNPDDGAVCIKALSDLRFAAAELESRLKNGTLTDDFKARLLSLSEHHLTAACRTLGYAANLAVEAEQRHKEIRAANIRIRELQAQMGRNRPLDGLPEQLQVLAQEISAFWGQQGFNYVSEINFTRWGTADVKFGFSFRRGSLMSDTPVSDEKREENKVAELQTAGFIFVQNHGDLDLLDCDENRGRLTAILRQRFPSLSIFNWENLRVHDDANSDAFQIRAIHAFIRNIHDIPARKGDEQA